MHALHLLLFGHLKLQSSTQLLNAAEWGEEERLSAYSRRRTQLTSKHCAFVVVDTSILIELENATIYINIYI